MGHDDPQHMLHSAANALARKLGVESTSIDTPEDQAKKSVLQTGPAMRGRGVWQAAPEWATPHGWQTAANNLLRHKSPEHMSRIWDTKGLGAAASEVEDNPDFKSAMDKLGPDGLKTTASLVKNHDNGWMYNGDIDGTWNNGSHPDNQRFPELDKETKTKLNGMSQDERMALSVFLNKYKGLAHEHVAEQHGLGQRPALDAPTGRWVDQDNPEDPANENPDDLMNPELPVHQVNTYNKRPKKLGMSTVDKASVLGHDPNDKAEKVQYGKIYKTLEELQDFIEALKKARG
jgi:hypothetical protein